MQPLFTHNPLLLGIWVTSILIWRVLETIVDLRTFRRFRTGIQRQDRGSHMLILILVGGGVLLGVLLAFQVSVTTITGARMFLSWLGTLLIYAGIVLRIYAITVLGAFFTTTLAVAPEQTVIETGPYRFIRHPSYTGVLMILLGLGLSLTNWLSLLIIMSCSLIGLGYRIHVEERVLQEHLGQRYQEYMQRTKRLIPFVL